MQLQWLIKKLRVIYLIIYFIALLSFSIFNIAAATQFSEKGLVIAICFLALNVIVALGGPIIVSQSVFWGSLYSLVSCAPLFLAALFLLGFAEQILYLYLYLISLALSIVAFVLALKYALLSWAWQHWEKLKYLLREIGRKPRMVLILGHLRRNYIRYIAAVVTGILGSLIVKYFL